MLYSEFLPSGRAISCATLGAVLLITISDPGVGLASSCPSVADPQGINSSQPYPRFARLRKANWQKAGAQK